MLISELLNSSLRKIGALSSGETIEPTRQTEALTALQVMLRSWGSVGNKVFATVKETQSLVSGQLLYTWGSGGDFDSLRPNQIIGAYILDSSGGTHPVDIITEKRYNAIALKETSGRPYDLFLHFTYPLAEVYLYPVPNTVEDLCLVSYKPFTETDSFAAAGNTLAFPVYYEEAIIYNLAIRLAPEYGRTIPPEIAVIAKSSLLDLTTLHAANRVEPVYIAIPAGGLFGAGYSINTNSYR